MSTRHRWLVALLVSVALGGAMAVAAAPEDGRVIGIWPVGLAAIAVLVAGRRLRPAVVAVVFVIAVLTIWLGGRPLDVAVGFAVGIAAEAWLVWWILAKGGDERPRLQEDADLRRFVVSALAGGAVGAASGALTSAVADWGDPGVVALALGAAHLGSLLVLLPFACVLPDHDAVASPGERVLQWALLAVAAPLVFWPTTIPTLPFILVPLLAWGALRVRALEALGQLALVLGCSIVLTSLDRGPFASVPKALGYPVDTRGILLAAFAVTSGLLVLPLTLRVGEQVATAREARAERDRLRNIVDGTVGVAIIGTDAQGRVTLFNPGAERLLGYDRDEMLGRPTRHLHPAATITEKADELGVADDFGIVARRLATSGGGPTEITFRRKDGVERRHAMTLSQIVDDRGRIVGFVSTSEDITDRVREQEALEEALRAEREAVERLQQVDAVKDTFVSTVSHELRTPITSILGYLELLAEGAMGDLAPAQEQAIGRVSSNSRRLLRLIDDLLVLSRMQDGALDPELMPLDLRAAVRSGFEVVAPAWVSRTVRPSLELPDDPVPVLGDRDMLERVVVNLVSNAVKFTPDGGLVAVRLDVEDGRTRLIVSDTGLGIPPEEQERLFTRFFRSSLTVKAEVPGSGLGLAICHAIVEAHGGSVGVESTPGSGSTFRVTLPLWTEPSQGM